MGAIISAIVDPITQMVGNFVGEIGKQLGVGFSEPIKLLNSGLKEITSDGWKQLGRVVDGLTNNGWFEVPDKAVKEFEKLRVDMKPWFGLPQNITANMYTVTSIMEYLSEPVYVLIIISCVFLSVLIIRGLFKASFQSVQDCLDTWFYFERNEKHMRLPGGPEDKEWNTRYSCWRRFLTCFYRRRIYVTDLEDAPHVPDMVKRYEEKTMQTIHI